MWLEPILTSGVDDEHRSSESAGSTRSRSAMECAGRWPLLAAHRSSASNAGSRSLGQAGTVRTGWLAAELDDFHNCGWGAVPALLIRLPEQTSCVKPRVR